MKTDIYFYNPTLTLEECKALNNSFIPATGLDCWINQSYLYLREELEGRIHLVNEIPESGIIIFHPKYFPKNFIPSFDQFLICTQADLGRHKFAQFNLVQNQDQLTTWNYNKRSVTDRLFSFSDNYYIPHWQHPHLIKRKTERSNLIEKVAFFGDPKNIDSEILNNLSDELELMGINFDLKMTKNEFYDYSEVDVSLAIRSFSSNRYINKPFWKILNSVMCGSLILAAGESSSLHFKKMYYPELPIINSRFELIRKLQEIKMDPYIHFIHLRLAQERLTSIYHKSLVDSWLNLFELASIGYMKWKSASRLHRELFIKYRSI